MGDVAVVALVGGLAAYRLWRLAALDTIADAARWRLLTSRVAADPDGPAAAVLHWLSCPWCAGFWIAGAITVPWAIRLGLPAVSTVAAWWAAATLVGTVAMVTGDGRSDA